MWDIVQEILSVLIVVGIPVLIWMLSQEEGVH